MPRSPWQPPVTAAPPRDPSLARPDWHEPPDRHPAHHDDAPQALRDWLGHIAAGRIGAPSAAPSPHPDAAVPPAQATSGDRATLCRGGVDR